MTLPAPFRLRLLLLLLLDDPPLLLKLNLGTSTCTTSMFAIEELGLFNVGTELVGSIFGFDCPLEDLLRELGDCCGILEGVDEVLFLTFLDLVAVLVLGKVTPMISDMEAVCPESHCSEVAVLLFAFLGFFATAAPFEAPPMNSDVDGSEGVATSFEFLDILAAGTDMDIAVTCGFTFALAMDEGASTSTSEGAEAGESLSFDPEKWGEDVDADESILTGTRTTGPVYLRSDFLCCCCTTCFGFFDFVGVKRNSFLLDMSPLLEEKPIGLLR